MSPGRRLPHRPTCLPLRKLPHQLHELFKFRQLRQFLAPCQRVPLEVSYYDCFASLEASVLWQHIHWIAFLFSGDAKPKGKAKAKKKASQENPKAVWDLKKARLSTLDTQPFPLVDRTSTKELVQQIMFSKAPKPL